MNNNLVIPPSDLKNNNSQSLDNASLVTVVRRGGYAYCASPSVDGETPWPVTEECLLENFIKSTTRYPGASYKADEETMRAFCRIEDGCSLPVDVGLKNEISAEEFDWICKRYSKEGADRAEASFEDRKMHLVLNFNEFVKLCSHDAVLSVKLQDNNLVTGRSPPSHSFV